MEDLHTKKKTIAILKTIPKKKKKKLKYKRLPNIINRYNPIDLHHELHHIYIFCWIFHWCFHGNLLEFNNPMSLCFLEGPEGGIGIAFGRAPKKLRGEFWWNLGFNLNIWELYLDDDGPPCPCPWASWPNKTMNSNTNNSQLRTRIRRLLLPIILISLRRQNKENEKLRWIVEWRRFSIFTDLAQITETLCPLRILYIYINERGFGMLVTV